MKFLGKIISGNVTRDVKESYLVPKNPMPLDVGVSVGEPLFTLVMAYFILQEKILLGGLIGASLLIISLVIAIVKKI